jgi:hypothetical protein
MMVRDGGLLVLQAPHPKVYNPARKLSNSTAPDAPDAL